MTRKFSVLWNSLPQLLIPDEFTKSVILLTSDTMKNKGEGRWNFDMSLPYEFDQVAYQFFISPPIQANKTARQAAHQY